MMRSLMLSGGFVVANLAMLRKGYGVGDIMGGLWTSGDAVRALAWDAGLGAFLSRVLWWGGGV